nr:MAG TPA: hypothetical protein [Caudoviricetes sp.]
MFKHYFCSVKIESAGRLARVYKAVRMPAGRLCRLLFYLKNRFMIIACITGFREIDSRYI